MIMISFNPSELYERFDPEHQLDKYAELLLEENLKINLVSRETKPESLKVMIAESLLPLIEIDRTLESYLDIGSGGGLPAIPLLLSSSLTGPATLVERTQKKAAALKRLISALGLKATILPEDFLATSLNEKFDLVTLRYLTPDNAILKRIASLLTERGRLLHFSSKPVESTFFSSQTWTYQKAQTDPVKGFTLYQKI